MLDIEFYRTYYGDMHNKTEEEIVEHWNTLGKEEGRFANPFDAREFYLNREKLPEDFILETYLKINHDVNEVIRWDFEGIIHYLEYGIKENRVFREPLSYSTGTGTVTKLEFDTKDNLSYDGFNEILPHCFNIVSYLANNKDIFAVIKEKSDGFKHYIEYGRDEKRAFKPIRYDATFIYELYGVKIPSNFSVDEAVLFLREKTGSTIEDLLFFDISEICIFNNVNIPYFAKYFDHNYYVFRNNLDKFIYNNRSKCIKHYCEVGQHKRHDFSIDCAFDYHFYNLEYYKEANVDASDELKSDLLYKDWIRSDSINVRWPNLNLYASSKYNIKLPNKIDEYVKIVSIEEANLQSKTPTQIVDGILDGEISYNINELGNNLYSPSFYTSIADRLSLQDRLHDAARIYSFVLSQTPHYPRALNHWADQAQRSNDIWHAVYLRTIAIDKHSANEWTYLNLAQCLINVGDSKKAVQTLALATRKFPADVGLRTKLREVQINYFYEVWSKSAEIYVEKGSKYISSLLKNTVNCFEKSNKVSKVVSKIETIAIYANCDIKQCEFYRVNLRKQQLKKLGYNVIVYNYSTDTQNIINNMLNVDYCIIYRVPSFPHVIDVIKKLTDLGITTIYDIDDLVFDTNHFPPALDSYNGLISAHQHAEMACGVNLFAHTATLCDFGMASTEILCSFIREYVKIGKAFCLPNSLGELHYESMKQIYSTSNEYTTIFYGSATKAHKKDLEEIIIPVLKRLFISYQSKIRVIFMGDIKEYKDLEEWSEYIVYLSSTSDIKTYWEILKRSDINLAILNNSVFNDGKSEIKWMEAAMFGIPSVVSDTATYRSVVAHGKTGYLCSNSEDFYFELDKLISSKSLRVKIGAAAKKAVTDKYSIEAQSDNLKNIITQTTSNSVVPRYRIVIVNVFYPPQAIGGATRVVYDNVLALKNILGFNWQIDVICTLEGGAKSYELDWYSIDDVRVFCITAKIHASIDSFVVDPEMGSVFDKIIDHIQPNLIHFHCIQRLTVSCVDVVRDRGIPYIITMHDGWWISPFQFLINKDMAVELYDFSDNVDFRKTNIEEYERRHTLKRALDNAARLLTVSESFAKLCRSTGIEKIDVIENGVSNLKKIERTVQANDRVTIGFFGGLSNHKGFSLIRNIFASEIFLNIDLLVIDHAMHSNDRVSERWGTTPVLIRGKAPQSQVEELYTNINVLLAPSVWPESYGLVTREALALGCWVVASNRGAVADCIIEGKNGYVINVEDEHDLARVLKYIDSNVNVHRQSPNTHTNIRTSDEQANDLAELYKSIIENQK